MFFDEKGCGRLVPPTEPLPDLGAFGTGLVWLHFDLKAANLCPLINAGHLGLRRLVEAVFRPDEHQRVTLKTEHVGGVVADLARPGAQRLACATRPACPEATEEPLKRRQCVRGCALGVVPRMRR